MVKAVTENATSSSDETLSALMDDQAQELELRRLLRDMGRNTEISTQARQRWYRQTLVHAALKGDPVMHAPEFSASVRAAIDGEPQQVASASTGWRRALGSFAVAASVAAVVVVGGQQIVGQGEDAGTPAAGIAALPVGVVNTTGAVPVQASFGNRALPALKPAERTAYRELARQKLRLYSQQHAEHASLNTPQGLIPFARVPVNVPVTKE